MSEDEEGYSVSLSRGNSVKCIESSSMRIYQVRHILELCIILLRLY